MIVIADKGRALVDQIRPEYFTCLNNMMNQFNLEEKQQMISWLDRFSNTLAAMTQLKSERKLNLSELQS